MSQRLARRGSGLHIMPSRKFLLGLAVVSFACSACGRRPRAAQASVPPPSCCAASAEGSAPAPGNTETGYASWYGDPYHGRRAANGEVYDKNKLTAAHLTLPFGTQVKVTDLENNRSVHVRINDRGPFVKGRIVDLSLAAARQIQMVGPGTALVRIEILSVPAAPDFGAYAVQVAAYRDLAIAERLQKRMAARYGKAFIENYESTDGLYYRVRIGPKPSLLEARQLAAQLGRESLGAFVVRVN
jgi:rare lipoprotein A